ncbi:uncharacterized protein L969DRAFT_218053 [Mixia osmundae IAM 14324]|nr:uncharacterized protein L969DRAFT_218053 [Mixia osmundae IAM 14324]KEI37157.1 hypothetical protein L969DRAFT_218053 [Mixia osmundae IAM 14324]
MSSENSVVGEVKLRFRNIQGRRMTTVRRLQVTKKKGGGLTMKSLEATISFDEEGKDGRSKQGRQTLSTKAAELDEEVPIHLGVSKAILENVIFCHQEDSNWPLSEPSILKKKFDDIFEATKYTKALKSIQDTRKESVVELKIEKERESALKIDRERSDKIERGLEKLDGEIERKEAQLERLTADIRKLDSDTKDFYERAVKHNDIISKAQTLQHRMTTTRETMANLETNMTLLEETDDELTAKMQGFQQTLETNGERRREKARAKAKEEDVYARLGSSLNARATELGSLSARLQEQDTARQERATLVQELGIRHDISGFSSSQISDDMVVDFRRRLQNAYRALESEIAALKITHKRKQGSIADARRKLESDQSNEQALRRVTGEKTARTQQSIKITEESIRAIDINETAIAFTEADLKSAKDRLMLAEKEMKDANYDATIAQLQFDDRELEDKRETAQKEFASLQSQAGVRAELAIKRQDAGRRQTALDKLIADNNVKATALLGGGIVSATFDEQVSTALADKSEQLAVVQRTAAVSERQQKDCSETISRLRRQVDRLLEDQRSKQKEIKDGLADTDGYASIAEAIERDRAELQSSQDELGRQQVSSGFYDNLLEYGKKGRCFCCRRPMSPEAILVHDKNLRDKIRDIPDQIKQLEGERDSWQTFLADWERLLPIENDLKRLEEIDLPKAQTELKGAEDKLTAADYDLESARGRMSDLKLGVSDLQVLKRAAIDMARLGRELQGLNADVADLETSLAHTGSIKTVADVQTELDALSGQMKEKKREMQLLANKKDQQNRLITGMRETVSTCQMKLNQQKNDLARRAELQNTLAAAQKDVGASKIAMEEGRQRLQAMQGPLDAARDELEQALADHSSEVAVHTTKLGGLDKSLSSLDALAQRVQRYETDGTEAKLRACEAAIKDIEAQRKGGQKTIKALTDEIAALDKQSSEAQSYQRNLEDNQRYRNYKKELAKSNDELSDLDVESANRAKKQFEASYTASRAEQESKSGQQAKLAGELEMSRQQQKERRGELDEEYKDIRKRHLDQVINVKTLDMAIHDMEKYGKALDSAIMAYHSAKMQEINNIIRELWTKTYTGSDIDKIAIVSDGDGATKARTYNYRVVMDKDGVQMDMRGRCSAGQKVLASIIIRLALAESFSASCGIMALDEPTTNLDRANIASLAIALSDIVKERKNAKFQLIIITHDEELLNHLGGSSHIDRYYYVKRENNRSVIEKRNLHSGL